MSLLIPIRLADLRCAADRRPDVPVIARPRHQRPAPSLRDPRRPGGACAADGSAEVAHGRRNFPSPTRQGPPACSAGCRPRRDAKLASAVCQHPHREGMGRRRQAARRIRMVRAWSGVNEIVPAPTPRRATSGRPAGRLPEVTPADTHTSGQTGRVPQASSTRAMVKPMFRPISHQGGGSPPTCCRSASRPLPALIRSTSPPRRFEPWPRGRGPSAIQFHRWITNAILKTNGTGPGHRSSSTRRSRTRVHAARPRSARVIREYITRPPGPTPTVPVAVTEGEHAGKTVIRT